MITLTGILIENYRSLKNVEFDLAAQADGSSTYGLIGLNEAGKSNILRALALANGTTPVTLKDFHDRDEHINVILTYALKPEQSKVLFEFLRQLHPETADCKFEEDEACFNFSFSPESLTKTLFLLVKKISGDVEKSTWDWEWYRCETFPPEFIHSPIFWAATENYLISRPIELTSFAENPEATSIPLRNCFLLAGISDIRKRIALLQGDSTEIEQLHVELGSAVTRHIQKVWPKHPVEISFLIANNMINFHVRDTGADGKAKTVDQRSDGFRQFISFLLTVSAQNQNQELKNSLLLLDEPETHLHPLAQEYLLAELIKITSNKRSNMVFFATHSNYMIDKSDLSRNFKVSKTRDTTRVKKFEGANSTYASVSYEVFSIASTDYHNELYGLLHEKYQQEDSDNQTKTAIKTFDADFFIKKVGLAKNKPWKGKANEASLPTYVRNCIHHPDNGDRFTDSELRGSIELMRKQF